MAKISTYLENTLPNSKSMLLVEPTTQNYKYRTPIENLLAYPFRSRLPSFTEDFMAAQSSQMAPFSISGISTGTFSRIDSESNHPGIWRIASSAAGNSGYAFRLGGLTSVLFQGGEIAEFVIRPQTLSGLIVRAGFIDTVTTTADVDSAHIRISSSTFDGVTRNNSSATVTATNYAVSTNTWYRIKIEVASDEGRVTFTIYNSSGTVLWTDSNTANIPTSRNTSFGILAYRNTASAASLLDIDWASYYSTKLLTR